jgi:hypothetical protein
MCAFLILSLLVFPIIALKNFSSIACILLSAQKPNFYITLKSEIKEKIQFLIMSHKSGVASLVSLSTQRSDSSN